VSPQDFELLSGLLKERSGLSLSNDKVYLLESRLTPVARRMGLARLEDLIAEIRRSKSEPLLRDVTEAMTTNESFFFRDVKPFEAFRTVMLPKLRAARLGAKTLRIWSAACSHGQEAYSLAMLLDEQRAQLEGWRIEIVATDIAELVMARAKEGLYSQFEVQRGLPIRMLTKHFVKEGDNWRLSPTIRGMVSFRKFNLLDDPKTLGRFDLVFCRNVLIYFDAATKGRVLTGIARQLAPDGFLVLGAAETVLGVTDALRPWPAEHGVYALAA
jgi:chemotaxis protein methyltransferase CheR